MITAIVRLVQLYDVTDAMSRVLIMFYRQMSKDNGTEYNDVTNGLEPTPGSFPAGICWVDSGQKSLIVQSLEVVKNSKNLIFF